MNFCAVTESATQLNTMYPKGKCIHINEITSIHITIITLTPSHLNHREMPVYSYQCMMYFNCIIHSANYTLIRMRILNVHYRIGSLYAHIHCA